MSTERQHHPFSPSKLQALEACPGYLSKSNTENAASLAGTLQHEAVEESIHLDDPALSDEQAEAVVKCKEYREAIAAKYPGGKRVQEDYLPIDDVPITVQNTDTKEGAGEFMTWLGMTAGYLDFAVISADGKAAEICDWKFGMWSVEPAENNLQGIAYLLGLVKRFPSLEQVTVHFVMPHRDEIDVATFKRSQFAALYLRVCTVVKRAMAADASKYSCTVAGCLFCGRAGTCTKLADFALKVGKKYQPAEVPACVTPSLFKDAADSSAVMGVAQLMDTWAKAVRAQITARAIEDENWLPEEYKLVSRTENEIKDWQAIREAARAAGVSEAAITEALTLRMTPLHKAINDAQPRGQKKAAVEAFTEGLLESGALEKSEPVYFLQRLRS